MQSIPTDVSFSRRVVCAQCLSVTRCLHFTTACTTVVQPVVQRLYNWLHGWAMQMSAAKRRLSGPARTLTWHIIASQQGGCVDSRRCGAFDGNLKKILFIYLFLPSVAYDPEGWQQEAQLSPRDRAMRCVNWNLTNCHATVQKLLVRQVLTKLMVWSWRFSRRQCVIDNVHSTMTLRVGSHIVSAGQADRVTHMRKNRGQTLVQKLAWKRHDWLQFLAC